MQRLFAAVALWFGFIASSSTWAQDPNAFQQSAPQQNAPLQNTLPQNSLPPLPYGNVVLPGTINNQPNPPPNVPPAANQPPAGNDNVYQNLAPLPGSPMPAQVPMMGPTVTAETKITPPPKVWEGSLELGLDGAQGNSDTFNFHVGGKLKHTTPADTLSSEFNFHENTSGGTTQTDRGLLEARYERLLGDSRFTTYIHDSVIYDEFQTYRLKDSIDAGLGYQFLKNDWTKLIGRFGAGETYECDGIPAPEWLAELVFGAEGEIDISKLQKLCGSIEYRPEWSDFSNYRVNAKASWEVILDEIDHLSMKVSLIDIYDAAAGQGKKPNDLDYAITLQLSF